MLVLVKKIILISVISTIIFLIKENRSLSVFFSKIKNLIILLLIFTLLNFFLGFEYYDSCYDINTKAFYSIDYILYVSISFILLIISLFTTQYAILKRALIVEFIYWIIKLFLFSGFFLSQIIFVFIAIVLRSIILKKTFQKNIKLFYICLFSAFIAFFKDMHSFLYFKGLYPCNYNIIEQLLNNLHS